MSSNQNDSGSTRGGRRLSLTAILVAVAVVAIAAVGVTAYGGSGSNTADHLSGKAKAGYGDFRDCMAGEGVTVSPDGPPAESEKTDKMRKAFEKCGSNIPSDVRESGGTRSDGSGKAAGFAEFRDCMDGEGVTVSPDGPPAESKKTDKMRKAFEKCGHLIPSDVRSRVGAGG